MSLEKLEWHVGRFRGAEWGRRKWCEVLGARPHLHLQMNDKAFPPLGKGWLVRASMIAERSYIRCSALMFSDPGGRGLVRCVVTRTFSETIGIFLKTLFPKNDVSLDTAVQSNTRAVPRKYLTKFTNRVCSMNSLRI